MSQATAPQAKQMRAEASRAGLSLKRTSHSHFSPPPPSSWDGWSLEKLRGKGGEGGSCISEKARLTVTENPTLFRDSQGHQVRSPTSWSSRCVSHLARKNHLQHLPTLSREAAGRQQLGAQALASDCLGLNSGSGPF